MGMKQRLKVKYCSQYYNIEALKTRKETGDTKVISEIIKTLKIVPESQKVKGKPHKLDTLPVNKQWQNGYISRRYHKTREYGIIHPNKSL